MSGPLKKPTSFHNSLQEGERGPNKPFSQADSYRPHTKQLSRTLLNLDSQLSSGMGSPSKYRSTAFEWHRKPENERLNPAVNFRRKATKREELINSPQLDPSIEKLSLQSGQDDQELKAGINMKFDGLLSEIQKLSEAIQKFNSISAEKNEQPRPSSSYRKPTEELPEKECLSVQHEPLRKWTQVSDLKKSMDISHRFNTPQEKGLSYSKALRAGPNFFRSKNDGEEEGLSKAESSPLTHGSAKDINIDELDDQELIELKKKIDSRIFRKELNSDKQGNRDAAAGERKYDNNPVPVYSMKKPPLYSSSKRYNFLIQSSRGQGTGLAEEQSRLHSCPCERNAITPEARHRVQAHPAAVGLHLSEPTWYIGLDNQEKFQGTLINAPREQRAYRPVEAQGRKEAAPASRGVRKLHSVPMQQQQLARRAEVEGGEEKDRDLTASNATFLESDSSILEIQRGIELLHKEGPFSLFGSVLRHHK
jgi:hypothetical protein